MNTHYFYFPDEGDYAHCTEVPESEACYKGTETEVLVAVVSDERGGMAARVMYDQDDGMVPADHEVLMTDRTMVPMTLARALVAALQALNGCGEMSVG